MTSLQSKFPKIIALAFAVVFLGAGLVYFGSKKPGAEGGSESGMFSFLRRGGGDKMPPAPVPAPTPSVLSSDKERFTHPTGMMFDYPKGFTVSNLGEGEGDTVLVQKSGAREEFQMFVIPFDEDGPITAERITQDLPDLAINEPQTVLIGREKNIEALIFFSGGSVASGEERMREVWFVWPPSPQPHGNYLYQLTTYADLDGFIGPILDTLAFQYYDI